ncbi:hypothetical protein N2S64_20660, partial [Escherichia coli]|nr:hypothetical protein [Escherichia coli]
PRSKQGFSSAGSDVYKRQTDMYVELLVVSFLVVLALPFILYAVHDRKSKANTGVTLEPINSQNAPKGHFFLHPRARSPHYIVMNDKKH